MFRAKPTGKTEFYADVARSAYGAALSAIVSKTDGLSVVFFETFSECELVYSRLKYFLSLSDAPHSVKVLPPRAPAARADAGGFDALCERTGALNAIAESDSVRRRTVVLCTPETFFDNAPAPRLSRNFELSKGMEISIESLREKLVGFGYYDEVLCESPGQFSVRGGVVDIYPTASQFPVRLDFFGDEVESIRAFNPDTQLADDRLERIRLDAVPDSETLGECNAVDYLPKKNGTAEWIFFAPAVLESKFSELFSYPEDLSFSARSFKRVFDRNERCAAISDVDFAGEMFADAVRGNFACEELPVVSAGFVSGVGAERFESETKIREKFVRKIGQWRDENIDVFIAVDGEGDRELAKRMFADARVKFDCKFVSDSFGSGFVVPRFSDVRPDWKILSPDAAGAAFVGVREFFGRRAKIELEPRRRMFSHRAQVDQLLDFSELGEGDYVVHLGHGVCRYHGVVKLDFGGKKEEAIKLEFEDEAVLYLPLHKSYLLSRYIGLDKKHPKLAKLDSKSWVKIKSAAETAAFDYAAELLEMQSRRELADGHAFSADTQWQREFDDAFPYTETPDQLRAIDEVKSDMESPKPMDRLLCADVGFGKTEVAMRAAFKCAMDGKQAAILCPTTILCQQHFRNFRGRFAGYPIVVEMLSRFRTRGEAAEIKSQLASGRIDIVIGTHALLADDVIFKDLGLLVIDEEHRFGVKHKERIKRMREGVDVLSMSATPIPRTLYFAMMGARTISLMETPPKNRFPVETIVREYSDETIREAVGRELARNGQVFYLHNRVSTIDATADKLRAMFPDARIAVGHGQMGENALERLMSKFVDGKYDILVCTTIIESGLDIPNCNTIVIEGADKFGLAQLYQLRGRVGRFTRRAYAWLILHRYAGLVESARKRLGAIRQYNKPGAGFRIATRDLQLRGCGNLLGAKQSGHIAGVGFDLYCSLLKRSVALLRGEKTPSMERAWVDLDFVKMGEADKTEIDVSNTENYFQEIRIREMESGGGETVKAYIPPAYIPQTQLRVDFYRRLSMAVSLDELEAVRFEMSDRFGKIPEPAEFLIKVARVRVCVEACRFLGAEVQGDVLKLKLRGGKAPEYFRMNGRFPRLTKRGATAKLREIEKFLTDVVPSIIKI